MRRLCGLCGVALVTMGMTGPAQTPAPGSKFTPKLEAVAETKLLMEGLAHSNFRGLERLLAQKPADDQAWMFARGQALLLAETGNLLMMRPPKTAQAQPSWFERATALRTTAAQLAQTIAKKDHAASRSGLIAVAGACNKCHQTFRVKVDIAPFAEPGAK